MIEIRDGATRMAFARTAITAAFASPSVGAEVTHIFSLPSAKATLLDELRGVTRAKNSHDGSGLGDFKGGRVQFAQLPLQHGAGVIDKSLALGSQLLDLPAEVVDLLLHL